MATCPSGHESADDDFCDVCGFAIGPATPTTSTPVVTSATTPAAAAATPCPHCGVPRAGQFCESCGYDFTDHADAGPQASPVTRVEFAGPTPSAPAQPASPSRAAVTVPPASPAPATAARVPGLPLTGGPDGAAWTAVVTADRAYYDSVQAAGAPGADGISFPVYCPQRRFRLAGAEVRVGRRSAHTGIDPEIDLTGPPADPGVSRLHVVLLPAPDGSWSVVDPGSANGTLVNGTEIARHELVPLHDGDRIHLGAWTLITLTRD